MSKTRRTNQGGSATVFVVVGIILVVGLIGSVYFAVKRGEIARKEQAIATYDKEQADKKAAEETNKAEEESAGENENTSTNVAEVATSTSELPVTGPGSAVISMVGAGFMTAALAGYLSSRRKLSRSL